MAEIRVPRSESFTEIAHELSDFIYGLPLSQPDNDQLIGLIIKQVGEAERTAFLSGFDMGIDIMLSR